MEDLEDLWADPHPHPPQTSAPRSNPPWPVYEPPQVQLARLQEANGYLRQMLQANVERLHVVTLRMQDLDKRVQVQERWQTEAIKVLTQVAPVLERMQRWQTIKAWLKDALQWLAAGTTVYLFITGKLTWEDVLRALGKI